jgi:ribosomal protein S18 acetylase RimI-like enzyme
MRIRQPEPTDADDWRRLWSNYLGFYETEVDEAVYQALFASLVGNDPGGIRGLLAVVGGIPVGLAHYLFHRHGWKLGHVCYLQDLWVEPRHRGSGLGEALIRAVYAAADTAGAPDVYWLTAEDNETARRLYERVGRLTPFVKYVRA